MVVVVVVHACVHVLCKRESERVCACMCCARVRVREGVCVRVHVLCESESESVYVCVHACTCCVRARVCVCTCLLGCCWRRGGPGVVQQLRRGCWPRQTGWRAQRL